MGDSIDQLIPRLRELRKIQGLTQEAFSEKAVILSWRATLAQDVEALPVGQFIPSTTPNCPFRLSLLQGTR